MIRIFDFGKMPVRDTEEFEQRINDFSKTVNVTKYHLSARQYGPVVMLEYQEYGPFPENFAC